MMTFWAVCGLLVMVLASGFLFGLGIALGIDFAGGLDIRGTVVSNTTTKVLMCLTHSCPSRMITAACRRPLRQKPSWLACIAWRRGNPRLPAALPGGFREMEERSHDQQLLLPRA